MMKSAKGVGSKEKWPQTYIIIRRDIDVSIVGFIDVIHTRLPITVDRSLMNERDLSKLGAKNLLAQVDCNWRRSTCTWMVSQSSQLTKLCTASKFRDNHALFLKSA